MITPWREARSIILAASMMGLTAMPSSFAHGGHGGAHAAKPPHISGGGGGQHAFRAPHMATPNFNNNNFNNNNGNSAGRYRPHASGKAAAHRANAQALNAATPNLTTHNTQNHASLASSRAGTISSTNGGSGTGLSRSATTSATISPGISTGLSRPGAASIMGTTRTSTGAVPATYTYGTGQGARPYRAYGYGSGYRNRRYGNNYGYGRSQGNNRAIVGRLRSVHSSLARLDRDYQGHRVRAMHAVSMAIRQLSHGSMGNRGGGGFGVSMMGNNGQGRGMGMGMGQRQAGGGANGAGNGNRQRGNLSQAQSDARMSQDLRILQGINMQLGNQGNTMSHQRASGSVQRAIHELNVALTIR